MKQYPLSVQSVGDDTYIVMSKGHHDLSEFMREVAVHYGDWPLGDPEHVWMRTVPQRDGTCIYSPAEPNARGAWPATYCWERYGEDRYVFAQHEETGREWCGRLKDLPPRYVISRPHRQELGKTESLDASK